MGILDSVFGSFTARGKALALYRRGMQKAEDRNLEGAIEDYSAVVAMKGVPPDVVAMALFNRALSYSRSRDDEKAKVDLELVLEMAEAPGKVKDAASEKLRRMKRRPEA